MDIAKVMEECRRLFTEDDDNLGENANEFIKSKTVDDDFVQNVRYEMDDDIRMRLMEKMSSRRLYVNVKT